MIQCNAITNGLTIYPDNSIAPCCGFNRQYAEKYVPGQDRFIEIKQALKNDIQHPACVGCWDCEKNNISSPRENYNKTKVSGNDVVFLDVRNTNLCNLYCRMCGPDYSSTIAKANGTVNFIKHSGIDQYSIDHSTIRDVYFTGGEPLINPDHWQILDSIPNPELVSLRYNSNLTLLSYKDKHVFDYWKKFRSVFFQVSLEGYKEVNDLVRVGSNWDRIATNINSLIEFKREFNNIELGVFSCVNVLTVWDIEQLIDYIIDKDLTFNIIIELTGGWLSLNVIPQNKRHLLKDKLESLYTKLRDRDVNVKNRIALALAELDTLEVSDKLPETIANIQHVDKLYNINLFDRIKHNLL